MEESIDLVKKESAHRSLSFKHLSKLFYYSYYFSQGSQDLQSGIFHWIHYEYPLYCIDFSKNVGYGRLLKGIMQATRKRIENKQHPSLVTESISEDTSFMLGIPYIKARDSESQIQSSVYNELNQMILILNEQKHQQQLPNYMQDNIITTLITNIIQRDYKYLVIEKGRKRTNNSTEAKNHLSDPYLSHICEYGFLGSATGIFEYDHMFDEITKKIYFYSKQPKETLLTIATESFDKKFFPESTNMYKSIKDLSEVIKVYNLYHQEKKVGLQLDIKRN